MSSVSGEILLNLESFQMDSESRKSTKDTTNTNCDLNGNLKLSWTGDFESLKQFIEANTFTEGTWRSPGDERKAYSDGNTTITWWKKKKKMEFSGQEANKMKLRLCNVLIANIPSDNNMAVEGDNGNCLSTGLCNRKDLVFSTETLIDLSGLKEEVSGNSRAIDELQKQCSRNQILTDLEDIKCSIITLQSITDSLFSVVNVEKSCSCLIVETHNTTKNNGNPNRDESLIISECQRIENPLEDLCFNSTTHDANATKNNGSPKRDESIITSECRRIESPLGDLCLNQSFTDANIDTIKNNGSPKRDESLITSVCQRIENPFEIKTKGIQKHVDPPIISVCQPVEELCSTANTDVDNHMASKLSRLRNENDLLQRNVTVLRDENNLLRDTSEVLSIELEKRKVKPKVWDSSQETCPETQNNPQSEGYLPSTYSQPYIKSKDWRNYLRLVNRVTTSQIARDDITKSLPDANSEGQGNSFINQPGTGDDSIHPCDPTHDHNQHYPIPTRITLRTSSTNRLRRESSKSLKSKQANRGTSKWANRDKFFRSRPTYHQTDWLKDKHERKNWYSYYY